MSHQQYVAIDKSVDSDTDSICTIESEQDDPSFNILEETRSKFSNLSVKKKSASRSRISKKMDGSTEEDEEAVAEDVSVPELDEKDKKSYEVVQKIIEVGLVEKLKVDQCKVYLRKHGLRLTGNKDVLLHRIREHLSIMNGEGEEKYPASSFVMNCKGDACTGDVVMFEQNVYEMFNIAARSAGTPCGTRLVVGRIVKESYGAAKQQHTFTIEVLWSKGEKPLPPLHPLLIKGRNLYKLKTMRQRWEDEGERQKILQEKHSRGSLARSSREARIQEKEKRKILRENRILGMKDQDRNVVENKRKPSGSPLLNKGVPHMQPNEEHVGQKMINQEFQHKKIFRPLNENNSVPNVIPQRVPTVLFPIGINYKENNVMPDLSMGLLQLPTDTQRQHLNPSVSAFGRAPVYKEPIGRPKTNVNVPKSPVRMSTQFQNGTNRNYAATQTQSHGGHGYGHEGRTNYNKFQSQSQRQNFREVEKGNVMPNQSRGQANEQKQVCPYYPQGRCYYGDRCKYLH